MSCKQQLINLLAQVAELFGSQLKSHKKIYCGSRWRHNKCSRRKHYIKNMGKKNKSSIYRCRLLFDYTHFRFEILLLFFTCHFAWPCLAWMVSGVCPFLLVITICFDVFLAAVWSKLRKKFRWLWFRLKTIIFALRLPTKCRCVLRSHSFFLRSNRFTCTCKIRLR